MQGTTQANNIWCWWMMHNTNKERESLESMDQTQTTRCVSRFEPLALRSRLHQKNFQSTNLSTEDSHRGNLYRGGFVQPGVPNSSLNQYNLHWGNTSGLPKTGVLNSINTNKFTSQRGIQAQSTSTEEEYKYQPTPPHQRRSTPQTQPLPKREQITTPINLYQRGIQQIKEGTTSCISQPQTKSFSHR